MAQASVPENLARVQAPEAALSTLVAALGPDQVAELASVAWGRASDQPANPAPAEHQALVSMPASAQLALPPPRTVRRSVSGRLVPMLQASATASAPRLGLPSAWLPCRSSAPLGQFEGFA